MDEYKFFIISQGEALATRGPWETYGQDWILVRAVSAADAIEAGRRYDNDLVTGPTALIFDEAHARLELGGGKIVY